MKKLLFGCLLMLGSLGVKAQSAALNLQSFVGKYQFAAGSPLTELQVSVKDGKLYGVAAGQGEAPLLPTDKPTEFSVQGYDATVIFQKEGEIVKGLKFLIMGNELAAQKVADTSLNDFAGEYVFESGPVERMTVSIENGTVMGDVPNMGKSAFVANSKPDEFTEPNYNAAIKFVRDASGKVTGLTVAVQGMELVGKRK